jgi:hypothetical protein
VQDLLMASALQLSHPAAIGNAGAILSAARARK